MTDHTPGPWTVEERQTTDGEPWITVLRGAFDVTHNRAAAPGVVADSRYSAMSAGENRANAHLIAAAPDLLEALAEFVAACPRCDGRGVLGAAFEQFRSNRAEDGSCARCFKARAALAKARGEVVKE